MVELNIMEE
jgi:hypothetical protein